jgi:hypothetical protein
MSRVDSAVVADSGGDPIGMSGDRLPRFGRHAGLASEPLNAMDAGLEAALSQLTLVELNRLQDTLFEQYRRGPRPIEHVAKALERQYADVAAWFRFRESDGEAIKSTMLLGTVAVAIAWVRYLGRPAPAQKLQDAIARICEDHVYMLPIPRSAPCFCGSGSQFKKCHGRMPLAAPAV